jgi:hypothetical protein
MSQTARFESEMHSLSARLRKAQEGLTTGTIVDLAPIEQDVTALCRAVERLEPAEAAPLRPRLFGLLEEVTQLGENLRAGLNELAHLLSEATDRRRALTAYSSPSGEKP